MIKKKLSIFSYLIRLLKSFKQIDQWLTFRISETCEVNERRSRGDVGPDVLVSSVEELPELPAEPRRLRCSVAKPPR